MTSLDAPASVACQKLQRKDPGPQPRELAGIAWWPAKSATCHQPPAAASPSGSLGSLRSLGARDMATVAWRFARLRWREEPSLAAALEVIPPRLQGGNEPHPMDLANLAWGPSTSLHVNQPAMSSIAGCTRDQTESPDARQPASIAQARTRQTLPGVCPLSCLMESVVSRLDAVPAQQVGSLADACHIAGSSCAAHAHEAILQKLAGVTSQLRAPLTPLCCSQTGFHGAMEPLLDLAAAASQLGADQLGHVGSGLLLDSLGITVARPRRGFPVLVEIAKPESRKLPPVAALCRFSLGKQQKQGSLRAVSGVSDGLRAQRWLSPLPLSVGGHVDRSLCAEFQVLARTCDAIFEDIPFADREHFLGQVQLFISAPPCLSCIAAMRQFQLLLPSAGFEVSWASEPSELKALELQNGAGSKETQRTSCVRAEHLPAPSCLLDSTQRLLPSTFLG